MEQFQDPRCNPCALPTLDCLLPFILLSANIELGLIYFYFILFFLLKIFLRRLKTTVHYFGPSLGMGTLGSSVDPNFLFFLSTLCSFYPQIFC